MSKDITYPMNVWRRKEESRTKRENERETGRTENTSERGRMEEKKGQRKKKGKKREGVGKLTQSDSRSEEKCD